MNRNRMIILGILLVAAIAWRILSRASSTQDSQVPAAALSYHSQAMANLNRGDTAGAAQYFDSALVVMPDYAAACEGLRRIRPRAAC